MESPRTRPRTPPSAGPRFEPFATIAVDAVTPSERGFTLLGEGADRAQYRLDMRFELPLDPRTRAVLGELLSQSDLTISRRGPPAGRNS